MARRRHDLPDTPVIPPSPSTIDLHSHTSRSDGLLEPLELVRQASAAGVRLLAITDHDTVAGIREVLASGEIPAGLELIPGIELNAVVRDRRDLRESEVHILGLGINLADEALEVALTLQRDRRRVRFDEMVDRLREIGRPIDDALETLPAVSDDDALGRPRVARAMIAMGYAVSVEDAFSRYLAAGQAGYVPREGLNPRECIELVHQARGIASLAHFSEAPEKPGLIDELVGYGLDGIEVYYRSFEPATVAMMAAYAEGRGLVATGGSDYHGDLEPYAATHNRLWVPPEVEAPLRRAISAAAGASIP
ncbi:MAG: PHP domain-containing protein [Chloroflexota bacterium]